MNALRQNGKRPYICGISVILKLPCPISSFHVSSIPKLYISTVVAGLEGANRLRHLKRHCFSVSISRAVIRICCRIFEIKFVLYYCNYVFSRYTYRRHAIRLYTPFAQTPNPITRECQTKFRTVVQIIRAATNLPWFTELFRGFVARTTTIRRIVCTEQNLFFSN